MKNDQIKDRSMLNEIVQPLTDWYRQNKRILPWRDQNNAYYTWVSEIMLQQTRVEAVKPYFQRFIGELPDVQALAECPEEKLMKLWEGLGYYSRARNLHACAKTVCAQYGGCFPRTAAELTRFIGSPYLKVLYDVYHMQLNEGSLCDHIRAYADQFGHIHVADAPGRHEPGTGEIHYPAVFAALEQAGYRGIIGYELFPKTDTKTAVRAIMAD